MSKHDIEKHLDEANDNYMNGVDMVYIPHHEFRTLATSLSVHFQVKPPVGRKLEEGFELMGIKYLPSFEI